MLLHTVKPMMAAAAADAAVPYIHTHSRSGKRKVL